jgi:holo-ACP synthase CitX
MDAQKLSAVLRGRETWFRRRRAMAIQSGFPSLVELSINVPGWSKREAWIAEVFEVGKKKLEENSALSFLDETENHAGYFSCYGAYVSAIFLKKWTIQIEESFSWGRLFDIDCYWKGSKITRDFFGMPPRTCLLCDRAHETCITEHKHPVTELRKAAFSLYQTLRRNL